MNADTDRGYSIVHPNDGAHSSADSKVPGVFRRRQTRSATNLAATRVVGLEGVEAEIAVWRLRTATDDSS